MLYLYLSHSNRQVILPTATKTSDEPESSPIVSFLDESGAVVAMFLRADVALYSRTNLGPALQEREENPTERQLC